METRPYVVLDPALDPGDAEKTVAMCERFGGYGVYETDVVLEELGRGLAQRHDVVLNYLRTGGRHGSGEEPATLVVRSNYFRENLAYDKPVADGIEPLLYNERFVEASRKVYGRPIVLPAIAYANLLVPGQELALHTDVPEFRGVNRRKDPEWFVSVLHHSGLFEPWRIHISSAVTWFHDCAGGEFVFYADGPERPPKVLSPRFNTALVCDAESIYHGIDRLGGDAELPPIRRGMRLRFEGNGRWAVGGDDGVIARYDWSQLRFSITWKGYCFEDENERRVVEGHSDDLTREFVMERLTSDLRERGRIGRELPEGRELALIMIDEYIRFPPPAPAGSAEAGTAV